MNISVLKRTAYLCFVKLLLNTTKIEECGIKLHNICILVYQCTRAHVITVRIHMLLSVIQYKRNFYPN